MKIFNITLLSALISTPLAAETTNQDWEVGVFADYIKSATGKEFSTDWQQIEAGQGLGLDMQKYINESWNARVEFAVNKYKINNGSDKDTGLQYGIDAVYKIEDTDLYLFAGVRRFNNTKSYNAVDAGAGYNFDISDRFSFYSEAAAYRDINNGQTDLGFKLGFKYAFGGTTKSTPTPTPTSTPATAPVSKPAPVVVSAVAPVAASEPAPVAAPEPTEKKVMPIDTDNDGITDAQDTCMDTPANLQVDSEGCALLTEETKEFRLNVVFENNSALLKSNHLEDVQRLADFMQTHNQINVLIEGHSSASGSAKYNLAISQKRADAVKEVLISEYGISAKRLSSQGFGETQLLSTENTKEADEQNRRVVANLVTTLKKTMAK